MVVVCVAYRDASSASAYLDALSMARCILFCLSSGPFLLSARCARWLASPRIVLLLAKHHVHLLTTLPDGTTTHQQTSRPLPALSLVRLIYSYISTTSNSPPLTRRCRASAPTRVSHLRFLIYAHLPIFRLPSSSNHTTSSLVLTRRLPSHLRSARDHSRFVRLPLPSPHHSSTTSTQAPSTSFDNPQLTTPLKLSHRAEPRSRLLLSSSSSSTTLPPYRPTTHQSSFNDHPPRLRDLWATADSIAILDHRSISCHHLYLGSLVLSTRLDFFSSRLDSSTLST
ncbi:hypothetical protein SCHPADRAFT_673723 [Schizopora paradoxa]|uniref:Uncharacterized protein n=1 Tax=Schizopora paradoxa TaxID=27342 RepID=A0A0H2R558_9AGAM|nr:hypothetical protein SCHPADRAFT_673723 [Schizopora paradoxa]